MAYVITRRDSLLLLMAAGKIRDKLNFQVILCSIYGNTKKYLCLITEIVLFVTSRFTR